MTTAFRLPRVYPLTDVSLSGLTHSQQMSELLAGGATLIQLRDKNLSSKEFFVQAEAALKVARQHGVKLIINDRVDIAVAIGAAGVHLGQDDLPPEAARSVLGNDAIIGYSTHTIEQATIATRLPIDYLAIGPIFETKSKDNPDQVVGLEGLRKVRELVGRRNLVAIGGIGLENARDVIEAGADSVAVISALFTPPETISTNLSALINSLPV
jgi:thiamine-phosphate pyrophosphorylase